MEAVLALTKVPCILLATMGLHVTATPPHPPPAKSDQAPSTNWEVIVKQRGVPATIKVFYSDHIIDVELTSLCFAVYMLGGCIRRNIAYRHTNLGISVIHDDYSVSSGYANADRPTFHIWFVFGESVPFTTISSRNLPRYHRRLHPLPLLSRIGPHVHLRDDNHEGA